MQPFAPDDRVYVAGHGGMLGSALIRALKQRGYRHIVTAEKSQLDLRSSLHVDQFLEDNEPTAIIIAAGRVGGIAANHSLRANFLLDNLKIAINLIESAHLHNIDKLIFLSSSCVYPRYCDQPMRESSLLSAQLEFTNRPYAMAKLAGMELINSLNEQFDRTYYSVLPCNLYGPGDNFDAVNSHVIPALIRKFATATANNEPSVTIWGTGEAKREFMHSDDCADGIMHLAEAVTLQDLNDVKATDGRFYHFNLGSGEEVSIACLAEIIKEISGYQGGILYDSSQPDGVPQRLLDSSKARSIGWQPRSSLRAGLEQVWQWETTRCGQLQGHAQFDSELGACHHHSSEA